MMNQRKRKLASATTSPEFKMVGSDGKTYTKANSRGKRRS